MADEQARPRCHGECCRAFRLSIPLAALRRRRAVDGDTFQVMTMVRPLGSFPVGALLPSGELSRGGEYYTCRHLAPNGDCQIYENRPRMCRDFPNGPACSYATCPLVAAVPA